MSSAVAVLETLPVPALLALVWWELRGVRSAVDLLLSRSNISPMDIAPTRL